MLIKPAASCHDDPTGFTKHKLVVGIRSVPDSSGIPLTRTLWLTNPITIAFLAFAKFLLSLAALDIAFLERLLRNITIAVGTFKIVVQP